METQLTVDALRDAVILCQFQRVVHCAIAGYGCAAAFATQMGLTKDTETLREMLEAACSGDRTMSEIAARTVNARAS